MPYYAVIDTNVLVSALLTKRHDAATVQVVAHLFRGDVIPLFNLDILDEYNEVLRRDKFHFSEETVAQFIHSIETLGLYIETSPSGEILIDMKDLPFFEVTLNQKDAYLVTGNIKHFPSRPFIVTPSEFLEILHSN